MTAGTDDHCVLDGEDGILTSVALQTAKGQRPGF